MGAPAGNQFWQLRSEHGLHKYFETPEKLWEMFLEYVTYTKSSPLLVQDFVGKDGDEVYRKKEKPLVMEGFELYVGEQGGPWELSQYFANREGRYEDFVPVCSRIRAGIRNDQITGGMAGIYNPSITQRLNNLTERTETIHTLPQNTVDYSQLSDETLQEIENASKRAIGNG